MNALFAIARRDTAAMFLTFSGWVILSAWGVIASLVFVMATLREGEPATLRAVIAIAGWVMAVLAPAVSMRSFSEESRLGTMETLLSAPLSSAVLVLGKFLACVFVLLVMAAPVLIIALVAEGYGRIDPGELACGLLGLLLVGMAMTSVGVFVSTRTSSQVVAYLVTFFGWFALVVLAKGLPAILPQVLPSDTSLAWIDRFNGLDPLVRLDAFALGLLDTGNVAWFLAIAAFFLVAAAVSLDLPRAVEPATPGGRISRACSTLGFMLAAALGAAGLGMAFGAPALSLEVDLTKTRAYSLGEATTELLQDLQPGWSIRMLVSEDTTDQVTLRHVDEVLERMDDASDALVAQRIDPGNPNSIVAYEELLESLLAREAERILEWETAIGQGLDAFQSFRELGSLATPRAVETVALLQEGPIRQAVERVGQTLATVAEEGGAFQEFLLEALQSTAARPLPDWGLVRTSLISNNELYAGELEQLADLLRRWSVDTAVAEAARTWSAEMVAPVERTAILLRRSVESLKGLAPLEVARLGVAIAQGDAAIVEGPTGVVVIPSWQLFPASAVTREEGSVIGFDRRFRGEEILAATIRALKSGAMPRVVFVHSEERSMLRPRDDGMDVSAVANAMRTARLDVEEWMPGQTSRPGGAGADGQPTVWVILPPLQRTGLEYTEREQALIAATRALLEEGADVMLTPARSLLPLVGQRDPWGDILQDHGVTIETGRVIFEWMPAVNNEGDAAVLTFQELDRYPSTGGVLAGALRGKRLFLNHPTPIRIDADGTVDATIVAEVEPSLLRFIEDDWRGDGKRITRLPEERRFEDPQPIVVAIEQDAQRLLVVGSGGWLLSALVNDSGTLGGDRVVLRNPGNRELALSGVAWLAGMDGLVATTASGREVARFLGVTPAVRLGWGVALPVVLGIGPLIAGGFTRTIRRRAA